MNSNDNRMSTKESSDFIKKLYTVTLKVSFVKSIDILKSVLYILRAEKRIPNKFRMECCIEEFISLLWSGSWERKDKDAVDILELKPYMVMKYGNFNEALGNKYIQKVYDFEKEAERKREEAKRKREEKRRQGEEKKRQEEEKIQQEENEQRRKLRGSKYGGYNDATRGARLNQERVQTEEVTITEYKTREEPDLYTKTLTSKWYACFYYFIVIMITIIGIISLFIGA